MKYGVTQKEEKKSSRKENSQNIILQEEGKSHTKTCSSVSQSVSQAWPASGHLYWIGDYAK